MNLKNFLEGMAAAPAEQMDPAMLPRFKALSERDDVKAVEILKILDECAYSSLCSGFCIGVLDIAWRTLLGREGKTVEQGIAEATWRNEGVV